MRRIPLLYFAALLTVFAAQPDQRLPLTGKVTDASTKKAIPDFHLVLHRGTTAQPAETLVDRKVHNVGGRFTVLVPSGSIVLTIEAPHYLPAEQIVSGGGKTVAIAMQHGSMLQGRVLGPDGKPIAHVDVSTESVSPLAGRREIHTMTDANGMFSILVQPGDHTIHFKSEGLLSEERHVSAKVPTTKVPDVQVVRAVSLSGSVADDLGAPLPQARVRATLQSSPTHEMRDAMTNAEGKFTVEPLRPGRYDVEVSMAVHVPRKVENVEVPAASPLQVRLDRGALVRGFVRGSTDEERPYVSVYLGPTVMTLINLKEEFGINAVPAGKIPVYAETQQAGSVRRSPTVTIDTTNGGSTSIDLALPVSPVITGTLTEVQHAPSRPVVIRFVQPNAPAFPPPLSVLTNEDGSFRAVGLAPGTYEISVMGREVISPKTVTTGIVNSSIAIDVKPAPRPVVPGNLPPPVTPPHRDVS